MSFCPIASPGSLSFNGVTMLVHTATQFHPVVTKPSEPRLLSVPWRALSSMRPTATDDQQLVTDSDDTSHTRPSLDRGARSTTWPCQTQRNNTSVVTRFGPESLAVRVLSWILWSPPTPSNFYYYFNNSAQIRNSKQANHSGQSVINRNLIILFHAPNHFHSRPYISAWMTRAISPVGGGFAGLDCGARLLADPRNSINTRTLILGTFFLFVFSLSPKLAQ